MAEISDIRFSAEPSRNKKDKSINVKIDYIIKFFENEVKLNLTFWEIAAVIEPENEEEIYDYSKYLGLWWLPDSGAEDILNWIHYGTIAPDGKKEIHRSFEGEITGETLSKQIIERPEKLKSFVFINPQITSHMAVG